MEIFQPLASIFFPDGKLSGQAVIAAAALVVSVISLVYTHRSKPRPKLQVKGYWRQAPELDIHGAGYEFEIHNSGTALATDVRASVVIKKKYQDEPPNPMLRTPEGFEVWKSVLNPGDQLDAHVYFYPEGYGVNPRNPYANFRTKGLKLKVTYKADPQGRNKSVTVDLDDMVERLSGG